jgi:UDP-glucose 4-epimerase
LSVITCSIKSGVKKLIYFSSAAVKAKPLTPYALSKVAGENFVKLYAKDIKTIIVRPENIYGSGQNQAYGYVIHNFTKCIKDGRNIKIYGSGQQSRDFIYIDDVTSVVRKLLEKDVSGEVISLGTGRGTTILDLAKIIGKIMDKKIAIDLEPARQEPLKSVANVATLKKLRINSKNFVDLEEGIRKLIS